MKKVTSSTAKDVFSYLITIITLYVGVFALLALLFQYINFHFPDPLETYYTGIFEAVRMSISSLLVVWPVFLFMNRVINHDIHKDHSKQDIWVRKWLLYLTLFIAAIAVIIDLITLTNGFLGGDLTTRFVLKVIAVLVIALAVLWYYRWELIRDASKTTRVPMISAIITSVLLIGWVIAGFFIIGSPTTQRMIRFDESRASNLAMLEYEIGNYWQQYGALPESLTVIAERLGGTFPTDPITGSPYEYRVLEGRSYELCATFEQASLDKRSSTSPAYYDNSISWSHEAGRTCFTRTIDPLMYPVIKM